MSESPAPPVQPFSTTPDIPVPALIPGAMPDQPDLDPTLIAQPASSWFDTSLPPQAATIPYTPDSSSYAAGQPFQAPLPKSQTQQKPLFSWSGQGTANPISGSYRDFSQATPSTASSWLYGQTPSTGDSFVGTGIGLTPVTSHQPELSYTGISPTFAGLGQSGGLHTASLDVQPRRPGPIRHHSAHSVSGAPLAHSMGTDLSYNSYPLTYPPSSQVPPPLPQANGFTLSQPPFNARRPMVMGAPIFPQDPMMAARRLHPSPDLRSGTGPFRGMHRPSASARFSHMKQASLGQDIKPPRFKPTAEQKAILIDAYEKNPNPDAATREALAKQLGPDVKVKTLQIWFQNRRSKSKTKEQAALLPKPPRDRGVSHRRSASREIDLNALRLLTRNDDLNMLLLPISVFAFASWRRFSTPGSSTPDLGASLHLTPPPFPTTPEPFVPHLHVYSMRSGATFRLTIIFEPSSVEPGKVQITTNPKSDMETVAVRLVVRPGKTRFAMWAGHGWNDVHDFTDGNATAGGQCELTGKKELMVPAFTSVSDILSPSAPQPVVEPITPFGSSWKFPTAARAEPTASEDTDGLGGEAGLAEIEALVFPGQPQRSLSDSAIAPIQLSDVSDPVADFLLNPDAQMIDEPLDLSTWDLSFASSSFESDVALPSTAQQTPSAGHAPTGSISDSEHHSTDTGEASLNTPILDTLGLSELSSDQTFPASGNGGESSSHSMDFKWGW